MEHSTELYHHGILGQKWGVRRYQNKDGSLTEKGKKRYAKESTGNPVPPQLAKANIGKGKNSNIYSKADIKSLSDDEVQSLLNRIRNEQEYKRITAPPQKVSAGKKIATKIASEMGSAILKKAAKSTADLGDYYFKQFLKNTTSLPVDDIFKASSSSKKKKKDEDDD